MATLIGVGLAYVSSKVQSLDCHYIRQGLLLVSNVANPLSSTWSQLNSNVGLEEGEY